MGYCAYGGVIMKRKIFVSPYAEKNQRYALTLLFNSTGTNMSPALYTPVNLTDSSCLNRFLDQSNARFVGPLETNRSREAGRAKRSGWRGGAILPALLFPRRYLATCIVWRSGCGVVVVVGVKDKGPLKVRDRLGTASPTVFWKTNACTYRL